MQAGILNRGLSLLNVGGRLVYSTCSLNPIENEAVVASVLRSMLSATNPNGAGGGFEYEILDTSTLEEFAELNILKRRPGMTSWKVCPARRPARGKPKGKAAETEKGGDDMQTDVAEGEGDDDDDAINDQGVEPAAEISEEAEEKQVGDAGTTSGESKVPWVESHAEFAANNPDLAPKVSAGMWPSGDEEALQIPRCMRIYPHMQNTGGFFVAVIEKRRKVSKDAGSAAVEDSMAACIKRGLETLDQQKEQEQPAAKAADEVVTAKVVAQSGSDAPQDATSGASTATEAEVKVAPEDLPAAQPETKSKAKREREDAAAEAPDAKKSKTEGGKSAADKSLNMINSFKEDPYAYCSLSDENLIGLKQSYNLPDSFLRNFMSRNVAGDPQRSIYYTTALVRAIITNGQPITDPKTKHKWPQTVRMRLIFTGNKLFTRQGSEKAEEALSPTRWRVVSAGQELIVPHMPKERIMDASLDDLRELMSKHFPKIDEIADPALRKRVEEMPAGNHIVRVRAGTGSEGARLDSEVTIALWRAPASVNLMMEKQEKSAFSFRIFGKDLTSIDGVRIFEKPKQSKTDSKSNVATPTALATGSDNEENNVAQVPVETGSDDEDAAVNAM